MSSKKVPSIKYQVASIKIVRGEGYQVPSTMLYKQEIRGKEQVICCWANYCASATSLCRIPPARRGGYLVFLIFLLQDIPRILPQFSTTANAAAEVLEGVVLACEMLVVGVLARRISACQAKQRIVAHIGGFVLQ